MSYAIQYGPKREYERVHPKRNTGLLLAWVGFVMAIGAVTLFPEGVELLRLALCPWMNDAAAGAVSVLVDNISNGGEIVDALVVFCRDVLQAGAV